MVYVLLTSNNIDIDISRSVEQSRAGDIILTETIPIYNRVLRRLAAEKPDIMIYVRMLEYSYFPAIGAEQICGPDDMPILYNHPDDPGTDGE